MLLYFSEYINNFDQDIYISQISSIVFSSVCCPKCGECHTFHYHGTYDRCFRIHGSITTIHVQRVKCKSCGSTHALLPSFAVPFSSLDIGTVLSICESDSMESDEDIMVNNLISPNVIRSIRCRFNHFWKDLVPYPFSFSISDLVTFCIVNFKRQFLQIVPLKIGLIPT